MVAVTDIPPLSFDEFMEWYPENSENRYELRQGIIVEMPKPKGKHSQLAGDLAFELGLTIRQAQQPYFIPKFRGPEAIGSAALPTLALTVDQVFGR